MKIFIQCMIALSLIAYVFNNKDTKSVYLVSTALFTIAYVLLD